MTDKEIQSILDELNAVRPEKLNGKARKLFDTIMQIIDEKDDIKAELQIAEKVIDLMTEELINDGDFIGERPSKKSMIEHYYKKVEEK